MTDTALSKTSYLAGPTKDGLFMIGCLMTYDAGTVVLTKTEMRTLYGELRQLDLAGELDE